MAVFVYLLRVFVLEESHIYCRYAGCIVLLGWLGMGSLYRAYVVQIGRIGFSCS